MHKRINIANIRKNTYQNWNHYKYEDYNKCPICNGKLFMMGQVSDYQLFKCINCNKKFNLHVMTEEIEKIDDTSENASVIEKLYKIEFEVDTGTETVYDTAFVKTTNAVYARIMLKNYIMSVIDSYKTYRINYIGEENSSIITGKFGSKEQL